MEKAFNNHLIYEEIFSNLKEEELYKLWEIDFFKGNVQDFLNISKKIVWKNFIDKIELDSDFIEIFQDKLNIQCVLCEMEYKLIKCRKIKEYEFCCFESNNKFQYSYICEDCDESYLIPKSFCNKCAGNKMTGIMIDKDEDVELHERTVFFICCKPPCIKNICICDKKYFLKNENEYQYEDFFCVSHNSDFPQNSANCEIMCEDCCEYLGYDSLDLNDLYLLLN